MRNKRHNIDRNRRDFLRTSASGAATLLAAGHLPGFFFRSLKLNQAWAGPSVSSEFSLTAQVEQVALRNGLATQVWRYRGVKLAGKSSVLNFDRGYLGPVFRVQRGERIRIRYSNQIPSPSVVHWHGLYIPSNMDGHPHMAVPSGGSIDYEFEVDNRAGTYWFHPHPHEETGAQVNRGLAGLFLVSDTEEAALDLPQGDYELPLVIQDRRFDDQNQFTYISSEHDRMMGFMGDTLLVNGQLRSSNSVSTRPYRLRILNGSNARIYRLAWSDGTDLTIIGTDGGLLETPVQMKSILLAPAQRLDLWVDFSGKPVGEEIQLINVPLNGKPPTPETSFPVMGFRVDRQETASAVLPARLSTIPKLQLSDAVNGSNPKVFKLRHGPGRFDINGRTFDMHDIAPEERVKAGTIELWEIDNAGGMGMPHPIHIHGCQFQILDRTGSSVTGLLDAGWHDTVLVLPGERVRLLVQFGSERGLYMYHCHNLEHEDMGMMRNYQVE